MPLQTSFPYGLGILPKGSLATCEINNSYTGYTGVALPFGVAVVTAVGINGQQPRVLTPSAAITRIDGIAGRLFANEGDAAILTPDGYIANTLVRVYNKGVIVVYSETAVNPTLPVFVRIAANGALVQLGDFRATADGAFASDVSLGLRWRSTTTAAGLAELSINLS